MLPAFIAGIAEFIEEHLWQSVKDLWHQRSLPDSLEELIQRGIVSDEIGHPSLHLAAQGRPSRTAPTRLSATLGVLGRWVLHPGLSR